LDFQLASELPNDLLFDDERFWNGLHGTYESCLFMFHDLNLSELASAEFLTFDEVGHSEFGFTHIRAKGLEGAEVVHIRDFAIVLLLLEEVTIMAHWFDWLRSHMFIVVYASLLVSGIDPCVLRWMNLAWASRRSTDCR